MSDPTDDELLRWQKLAFELGKLLYGDGAEYGGVGFGDSNIYHEVFAGSQCVFRFQGEITDFIPAMVENAFNGWKSSAFTDMVQDENTTLRARARRCALDADRYRVACDLAVHFLMPFDPDAVHTVSMVLAEMKARESTDDEVPQ